MSGSPCRMLLSGLPRPDAPGPVYGDLVELALVLQRRLALQDLAQISMYSRVRAIGLPNGTPCQPSTTLWTRGADAQQEAVVGQACRVSAVIAVQAAFAPASA